MRVLQLPKNTYECEVYDRLKKNNHFPYGISEDSKIKMFCFPHAGGSASAYKNWIDYSRNTGIEVIPVEYPGRSSRFTEENMESVRSEAQSVAKVIAESIGDSEYVLYGHSFGSLITFHTEVELETVYGKQAKAVIVSGKSAPYTVEEGYKTEMGEELLVAELKRMKSVDEAILNNKMYLDFFLPIIMNDYRLNEQYIYKNEKINAKMIAFSSYDDVGSEPNRMKEWRNVTDSQFILVSKNGSHFFIFEEGEEFFREVITQLER